MEVFTGKLIEVDFWGKPLEAIVIDPNGQGEGKPTIGMGFGMTERHMGIEQSTLSRWTQKEPIGSDANKICMSLKLPSGKLLSVMQITDENNREQLVIEASDWSLMATDVLKKPGKLRAETKDRIIDFLAWFAVKGFYASCYSQLFGAYTAEDDNRVSQLLKENQKLQEELGELAVEYAMLEYQHDQLKYENDELSELAQWRKANSWTGRDC
jgi:hypothetical protein